MGAVIPPQSVSMFAAALSGVCVDAICQSCLHRLDVFFHPPIALPHISGLCRLSFSGVIKSPQSTDGTRLTFKQEQCTTFTMWPRQSLKLIRPCLHVIFSYSFFLHIYCLDLENVNNCPPVLYGCISLSLFEFALQIKVPESDQSCLVQFTALPSITPVWSRLQP